MGSRAAHSGVAQEHLAAESARAEKTSARAGRRTAALAAVDELHHTIDEIIERRRRSEHAGNDLLSLMLAARDEHGEGMSRTQLRDEIKTAIFAGYDSTASGLAWTWYMLATHPESARRAREEPLRIEPDGAPSAHQVQNLDYIGRAFQDTLRLYPPFRFTRALRSRTTSSANNTSPQAARCSAATTHPDETQSTGSIQTPSTPTTFSPTKSANAIASHTCHSQPAPACASA